MSHITRILFTLLFSFMFSQPSIASEPTVKPSPWKITSGEIIPVNVGTHDEIYRK